MTQVSRDDSLLPQDKHVTGTLRGIGRAAVLALYDELALAPKPGLVSFIDSGSHDDMDARTFLRSLFSLRQYFPHLAELGAARLAFAALERAGIAAEARMLVATGGLNTHRGAIFCLGLLCASAGALAAQGAAVEAPALRGELLGCWGQALSERAVRSSSSSHGAMAARRFGLRSATTEAALGFPVLFETTLPALLAAQRRGATPREARLQALFETMAVLEDTNLAHRGGLAGLRHAQRAARTFLAAGGALRPDALAHARVLHADFVSRHLSPGGTADMLAAACWAQRVCGQE
jgi:triphosphoribosyl-dephospho-CoA synthase